MQKTITINGKRYNGKAISKIMEASHATDDSGIVKFITLSGKRFWAEYRDRDIVGGYWAPVVKTPSEANAIKLIHEHDIITGCGVWIWL